MFAGLALPTTPVCVSCLACALILVWLASCHELSRQIVNLRHYTPAHLNQCRLSTSSTSELHQSCPARPLLDSRLRRRRLQLYPTHWPLLSLARPPGLPAATPHPHPARCHSPPSLPTTDVRRLAAAPHRSTASQHRTTAEARIASIPRSIASCGFLQLVLGPLSSTSTAQLKYRTLPRRIRRLSPASQTRRLLRALSLLLRSFLDGHVVEPHFATSVGRKSPHPSPLNTYPRRFRPSTRYQSIRTAIRGLHSPTALVAGHSLDRPLRESILAPKIAPSPSSLFWCASNRSRPVYRSTSRVDFVPSLS